MKIETPNWKRSLKIKSWSLGNKRTFLRILEPKKERGIATLKIGNRMWNYLPKIDKIMKIPPSMMMSSWMGSDFTNDDFVKMYTFIEDYDFKIVNLKEEENLNNIVYIECIPKKGRPIVWGKRILAVYKDTNLPLWEKFYDGKGKLVREMRYKKIKAFGKKTIPSEIELISTSKKGHKTIIIYSEAKFDIGIDKKTFSRKNLRKRI
jgi:outer membrane lipoprotein-sorting protein